MGGRQAGALLADAATRGGAGAASSLGEALFRELEWRASWPAGSPPPPMCTLPMDAMALSELPLPASASRAGTQLRHAIHCYCCAGDASRGRWAEAEAHAVEASAALGRLNDAGSAWAALCHAHNALLCAVQASSQSTGGGGGCSHDPLVAAPWRGLGWAGGVGSRRLLEQGAFEVAGRMREQCASPCPGVTASMLLQCGHGCVLLCWRLCGAALALSLAREVAAAALRLSKREVGVRAGASLAPKRQRGPSGSEAGLRADEADASDDLCASLRALL